MDSLLVSGMWVYGVAVLGHALRHWTAQGVSGLSVGFLVGQAAGLWAVATWGALTGHPLVAGILAPAVTITSWLAGQKLRDVFIQGIGWMRHR